MPKRATISKPPLNYEGEPVGERLARLRKERGFTQVELAEKVGTGQVLISAYETDRRALSAEMAVRFAIALDVTTDEKKSAKKPSLKLVRRMEQIEKLPQRKQDALLTTIDAFLSTVG